MNKITLGFSPCPNDTFIFDALYHERIDTEGLNFDFVIADVEKLNQRACAKDIAVTKLSYHALAYCLNDYALLRSGSALGFGNGPLLIARSPVSKDDLRGKTIAIPGKYTTANALLFKVYGDSIQTKEYLFSEIEEAVRKGETDAGLIIHENRFTYAERGFYKVLDLGQYWEAASQLPIPLGGIAANRKLSPSVLHKLDSVVRRSVQYAFDHPHVSHAFIREHAQELSQEVREKHINLYVNNFTLDLGKQGAAAVKYFLTALGATTHLPLWVKNIV